ncbi:uncharacterized protein LY89DRAFT_770615 [Mollisia scopiformis]|uniref:Gfd2/YDR514C-like C-terminal domain-containing protein n=1 Tax=Mollisia scopiformis TaxID=149040 RepID=A0A194XM48_MOLSC|nr:uncharacterized protein LY89DRAFT_770615 [Mollisia scopiformis]KUJ21320.1 hypothetical protein LY89DRAFT_770615 [Mollisia scopiformis]
MELEPKPVLNNLLSVNTWDDMVSLEVEPQPIKLSVEHLLMYRTRGSELSTELLNTPTLKETPEPPRSCQAASLRPENRRALALPKASDLDKLPIARRCFGLPGCQMQGPGYLIVPGLFKDAVIVSIDFENVKAVKRRTTDTVFAQMGVCILDTRDLSDSSKTKSPESLLRSYNFSTRAVPKWRRGQGWNFIFGDTTYTSLTEFCSELENLIDRSRNIIFLGHNVANDLSTLKALGFDVKTGVSAVLDTQHLMRTIFLPNHKPTSPVLPRSQFDQRLVGLLNMLGCECRDLHVGGNDANFTMRALLLLLVENLRRTYNVIEPALKARVALMESIARAKLPAPASENKAASVQPLYQISSTFEYAYGGRPAEEIATQEFLKWHLQISWQQYWVGQQYLAWQKLLSERVPLPWQQYSQ